MPESPRRVDLRLTIPAAAPYRAIATELAEKFAEYVGVAASAARAMAEAVAATIAPVADAQPDTPIDLEMTTEGRELIVTAHSGSTTKRMTCAIPD